MPIDFISVDRSVSTAIYAGDLINVIAQLRIVIDGLDRLKAIMTHNNDGTDFGPVEVKFGLATGKGQQVFDLINGTQGALAGIFQTADALTLIDRVG